MRAAYLRRSFQLASTLERQQTHLLLFAQVVHGDVGGGLAAWSEGARVRAVGQQHPHARLGVTERGLVRTLEVASCKGVQRRIAVPPAVPILVHGDGDLALTVEDDLGNVRPRILEDDGGVGAALE